VPTIPEIFKSMPGKYKAGVLKANKSFYFSIGDHKYTVKLTPESCAVDDGKTLENADCVLKCTPDIFTGLLQGKMPGTMDVMRGKIKTNDPGALQALKDCFNW
jgi:putative sterol carrier protein